MADVVERKLKHKCNFTVVVLILLVVSLTISCFRLRMKLQGALPSVTGVENCNIYPRSLSDSEMHAAFFRISRQAQRIAYELGQMALNSGDLDRWRTQVRDISSQLEARISMMGRVMGNDQYRRERLIHLAVLLQNQLHKLQYPPDCSKAKFVTTSLPSCGFGCQVHQVALAFHKSFALNRTLLVHSNNWHGTFHPITNCSLASKDVIILPSVWIGNNTDPNSPPALRWDWAKALKDTHASPYAWFRGQLIRFILRLKPTAFRERLERNLEADKSIYPLIGVHVRRTDKLWREAKYYPLSTYMALVDMAFRRVEIERGLLSSGRNNAQPQRTVYLASDDPSVFEDLANNYPQYRCLGEARTGSRLILRSSSKGLQSIIYDVFRLANCDYVVCTMSSNICRLVYELLLTDLRRYGDRSSHLLSVDVFYTMHRQLNRTWTVVADSPLNGGAKRGDVVVLAKDFHNGSILTETGAILPAYILEENVVVLPHKLN